MKTTTLLFTIIFVADSLFAQQTRGFVKIRQSKKDYIALIVGNSAYPDMPLTNPKNDAEAVAKAFEDMGFIVEKLIDADKEQMAMAIDRFSKKIKTANVAVFYFAGHGMQVDGANYLIPIGRTSSEQISKAEQLPYRAVNVGEVLTAIKKAQVNFSLIVLDACRNNPIGGNRGKLKGLASIDAPAGSLVMYATKAGETADDGDGKDSPFTTAFLQHITTPGLDINLLPSRITKTVRELTRNKQTPGSYVQISQSFTFVPQYTEAELEQLKKEKEQLAKKIKQKKYQTEAQRKRQKEEFDKLKAQLEQAENYDKENAEIESKQAEIEELDRQIENMKKQSAEGADNFDQLLLIAKKRKKQKEELDELKRKAKAEKIRKEKELAEKKRKAVADRKAREKKLKEMKQAKFDKNIAKYNKIANDQLMQDMKPTAWNILLSNMGLEKGSIEIDDISTLRKKLDLPTQFIDKRDGKIYKIVEIGNQVWVAENLAYKASSGCRAYRNVSKYGYLYNYETAKNVCPSGYHLPTKGEYEILLNNYGGYSGGKENYTALIPSGSSGFSAFLGGSRGSSGSFGSSGSGGDFWSASALGDDLAWGLSVYGGYKEAYLDYDDKSYGFSVRCVQDN